MYTLIIVDLNQCPGNSHDVHIIPIPLSVALLSAFVAVETRRVDYGGLEGIKFKY